MAIAITERMRQETDAAIEDFRRGGLVAPPGLLVGALLLTSAGCPTCESLGVVAPSGIAPRCWVAVDRPFPGFYQARLVCSGDVNHDTSPEPEGIRLLDEMTSDERRELHGRKDSRN